jgi:competence protein ComEA
VDAPLPRPSPSVSVGERIRDWLYWFGIGRLATIAASVLAIGAGGYWLLSPSPPPVEASLPMAAGASTTIRATGGGSAGGGLGGGGAVGESGATTPMSATSAPSVPDRIIVHVAGAVIVPGIHVVEGDARVADAVLAAGGVAPAAHADAINLAAPVHDGDRIYVPRLSDAVTVPIGVTAVIAPADPAATPTPVALNTATVAQLDELPGVGPATAAAIVAHRDANGPFASIEGLAEVRGIGPAKLEVLRPLVTL